MMTRKMIRGVVVGSVMTVVALVSTGESRGFFNFWQKRYNAAAAMYGGTTCNPNGQQLVANYVPQTCYRVQYCPTPVTTYRPMTSCDPCTGCQTTCMRPVTQYVQQARYTPYTTYRIQYSYAQPACPNPATAYYAPVAAPPSGCNSCGTGVQAAAYYAPTTAYPAAAYPVTTNYAPAAGYATPVTSYAAPTTSYAPAATVAPSGCASCGNGAASTSYYPPATSYAAPVYSQPAYATPSTQYSLSGPNQPLAPTYTNAPPTGATTYNYAPSSSAPSYSGSTYSSPSTYSATPAIPAPPTVPAPTYGSSPAPVTTNSPLAPPASNAVAAPTQAPAQPTPTAAPQTDLKPIAPHETLKPIPDPLSNEPAKPTGPKLNPMSTPRLFDPQDKTAAAWPVERAWGYAAVSAVTASRETATPVVHTTIAPPANDGWKPATLGAPIITQPQWQAAPSMPTQPSTDADGWRSTAR